MKLAWVNGADEHTNTKAVHIALKHKITAEDSLKSFFNFQQ